MKLSIYTFVRNGLYLDFHLVEMLKHHIPLADEIIVNEGYSDDGTYEAIKDINPKIQVFRSHWDRSEPQKWYEKFKNECRERCTGDWCILLDCDEFIPEWEFPVIRETLANTEKIIYPMEYINFYGNYRVFNAEPDKFGWPALKYTIHRNIPEMIVWGDGSNVKLSSWKDGYYPSLYAGKTFVTVHHFGFVRKAARLREKWRKQKMINEGNKWDFVPSFIFNLLPHNWKDPFFLPYLDIYDGPYIKTVRDNPQEFVRDSLKLYNYLEKRRSDRNET